MRLRISSQKIRLVISCSATTIQYTPSSFCTNIRDLLLSRTALSCWVFKASSEPFYWTKIATKCLLLLHWPTQEIQFQTLLLHFCWNLIDTIYSLSNLGRQNLNDEARGLLIRRFKVRSIDALHYNIVNSLLLHRRIDQNSIVIQLKICTTRTRPLCQFDFSIQHKQVILHLSNQSWQSK